MTFSSVEATIAESVEALKAGNTTAVDLTALALDRIAFYDRQNTALNAIPILNPAAFDLAAASDAKRRAGHVGPLEGICCTLKDSYSYKGLTVAAGSPAFKDVVAMQDAFLVSQIKKAGAIVLGLTNMPPMAFGGCQRGLYGRAESPYNPEYLAAGFASGSSNGSGVSVATSMGTFGLGGETVSSGRSPASNNGLVCYTPSRGIISVRGTWPLFPTCDVLVPHCRTMDDLLTLLNVICVDDQDARGDFWRQQTVVPILKASSLRPDDFASLARKDALKGKRLAVPRMYINKDSTSPIKTRPSIIALWEKAKKDLEALGAEIVETDFPIVTEHDQRAASASKGYTTPDFGFDWNLTEWNRFIGQGWHEFLAINGYPGLKRIKDADPDRIFPRPPGSVRDPNSRAELDYRTMFKAGEEGYASAPRFEDGLKAIEALRKDKFEAWLDANSLNGMVFPANADVGPATTDVDPAAAKIGWGPGVLYSHGNRMLRHVGIPTSNVPMGVMEDIGMPINLTFAGKAYSDMELLSWAWAFESVGKKRQPPARTPALEPRIWQDAALPTTLGEAEINLKLSLKEGSTVFIDLSCETAKQFSVTCNGVPVLLKSNGGGSYTGGAPATYPTTSMRHPGEIAVPEWGYAMVVAVIEHGNGVKTGKVAHLAKDQ